MKSIEIITNEVSIKLTTSFNYHGDLNDAQKDVDREYFTPYRKYKLDDLNVTFITSDATVKEVVGNEAFFFVTIKAEIEDIEDKYSEIDLDKLDIDKLNSLAKDYIINESETSGIYGVKYLKISKIVDSDTDDVIYSAK